MIRRVHVIDLHPGDIALDSAEAHHVRDVLRLTTDVTLELFDDAGQTALGVIKHINAGNVVVAVESVQAPVGQAIEVTVASAIPKGDRADWMIEKLAELGVDRFIPLAAQRSVVLPAGQNKIQRWERSAIEAAKQSRRSGVMSIAPLTSLNDAIASIGGEVWYLSTAAGAVRSPVAIAQLKGHQITIFIGPEGGWTPEEMQQMQAKGFLAVALTSTILRVETAAISAAAMVLCHTEIHSPTSSDSK